MQRTVFGAVSCAALLASAGVPWVADARTIITNANGYTIDGVGRLARFGTLIVGDDGRVEGTRGAAEAIPEGDVIDAGGATLLPGLIDAHGHIMGLGEMLRTLDLSSASTLGEAITMVGAYADANPDLPWIVGRGWNQVSWGMADFPVAADLDGAVADRPVLLARVDGHAAWVNSLALEMAEIGADTPDPDGGQVRRDEDGAATGILVDTAMGYVARLLPEPSEAELDARLEAALAKMAETGLTAAADMGTLPHDWQTFERFAEAGRLTARIGAYARPYQSFIQIAGGEQPGWQHRERLALSGLKLVVDGALGSRGAAMIEPYSDAPEETGLFIDSGAQLRNQMVGAVGRGYQLAVHAIGDAANREALDAFEDLQRYFPGGRHRIEHVQIVAPEDMERFAEYGLIASVQPTHATSDKAMAEDRVGPDRIAGGYAWRTLANSGVRLALGSDFPVEPVEPFYGFHAAITREDRGGEPEGGWYPGEALTPVETLAGFTTGAAYAMNLENSVGTLTPGKWADFILVEGDPMAGSPDTIWQMRVLETWVAGQKVYDADE